MFKLLECSFVKLANKLNDSVCDVGLKKLKTKIKIH